MLSKLYNILLLLLLIISQNAFSQKHQYLQSFKIADSLGKTARFNEAQLLFDSILKHTPSHTDFYFEILNKKAFYYEEAQDNKQAILIVYRVIQESTQPQTIKTKYLAYLTLALLYEKTDDFKNCKLVLNNALKLSTTNNLDSLKANYFVRISSYYRFVNKPDSAIYFAQKAQDNALIFKNDKELINAHLLLGILFKNNEWQQAIKHFEIVKNYFLTYTKYDDAAAMYGNISGIYTMHNNLKLGLLYNDSALWVIKNYQIPASSYIYKQRASIFEKMNYKDSALVNYKKYTQLFTQEFDLQKSTEIKRISTQYEAHEKELLLGEKTIENNFQKKIIAWAILFSVIITAVSLLLFFTLRKLKIKNKQVSQQAQALEKMLHQKDVLIQEIHHRVKNNFQIISGLMNMQLKNISDTESRKVFEDALQRIHSMAIIHQQLYSGENLDSVKIKEFLTDILKSLAHSDMRSQDFFSIDDADTTMHIEQAVPLGMIIHELATNSIKYAWQGTQNKKIDIHIENNNGALMLSYNDNGKGLPTNLDIKATTSLGLKLVDLFIHRQLQGSMIYENRNGAFFKFTFTLR
jgi:two-component sensor histidine kinase